jgi:hypothetical protein
MADLVKRYAEILTSVMIILGVASLIGTVFTKLLIFKIILGVDILFWIVAMAMYIRFEIEFRREEEKRNK